MLSRVGAAEEKVRPAPQPPPPREPMPEQGVGSKCRTQKEEDAAYTEQSQLWGMRPCAALGYNGRKKMPIQYGATLHAVSADGTDPSFR
jgi:hypothetical protein